MAIVEGRESIKRRLQAEAARQWGVNESDISNDSFDPLVNLLFGALAVESEKIWHEMEASRSRIVKRMVETVLPEVVTGTIPAHSVMLLKTSFGSAEVSPTDQFAGSGTESVHFSPAGNFRLSGTAIRFVATGQKIDKIGVSYQREPMIRLTEDKSIPTQTCWIGIDPGSNADLEDLALFINWKSASDRALFLSNTSSIQFYYGKDASLAGKPIPVTAIPGISPLPQPAIKGSDFLTTFEKIVRDYYYQHFITIKNLPVPEHDLLKKYPDEWETLLELPEKALFTQNLFWIKAVCPASISADALDNIEFFTDCIPVLNRKLNRQRGKIQPLFNVYALTDESGFLAIEKVVNGDGEPLMPTNQQDLNKNQNVYAIRKRNVARFDRFDAFESLTTLTSHMRDDLAAFNTLDNSILNNHLDTVNKGILKLKEHLDSFEFQLPLVYLLVKTKSAGNVLDVYFWSSKGAKGNGLSPLSRLIPEPDNAFKSEVAMLMLPSTGGRDPMGDSQMQSAFKEAILTRGKAVTIEDFRTIAKNMLGDSVASIEVNKSLSIGESPTEGVRRILEVGIVPNPTSRQTEDYWLKQAKHVKNELEQRSTGVLPLFVSVRGFNWKL